MMSDWRLKNVAFFFKYLFPQKETRGCVVISFMGLRVVTLYHFSPTSRIYPHPQRLELVDPTITPSIINSTKKNFTIKFSLYTKRTPYCVETRKKNFDPDTIWCIFDVNQTVCHSWASKISLHSLFEQVHWYNMELSMLSKKQTNHIDMYIFLVLKYSIPKYNLPEENGPL